MPAEEKKDVETKELETKTDATKEGNWDKERQQRDQAEANRQRATLRQENETLRGQVTTLQAQIADLSNTKKASEKVESELPELPEDASTEELAKAVRAATRTIKGLHAKLAGLETTTTRHEQETKAERESRLAEERRNETLNKVCGRLEKKHGAGLRNRAIAMMEALIDQGNVPADPADAALMLDECFAEAKKERDKKSKEEPRTDIGGGGPRPRLGPAKLKAGSLAEVAAQFAAAETG